MVYPPLKALLGNARLAIFLAYKSIGRGNRWAISLITLVMAFSYVNLIFTSSIISGVMITMDEQLVNTLFSNVVITPEPDSYYIERSSELLPHIIQAEGVADVCMHLNSLGFIEYGWKEKTLPWQKVKSGTWQVTGVDPVNEARVTIVGRSMIEGTYLDEYDTDQIVLGIEIAGGSMARSSTSATLGGIHTGERVQVTYPNGVRREYTVKGIFRAREMMRGDSLAFVTRKEMISVLGRQIFYDRASEILVKADRKDIETRLVDQLRTSITGVQIQTFKQFGSSYRGVISTFEMIMIILGATGLIVAATVMFIVIYINVLSKKRQIGILRAIGIPHSAVLGSYVLQALFYSAMGIALGWLLIRLVIQPYFMAHPIDLPLGLLTLHIDPSRLANSAVGLTAASLLAGLIPSWSVLRESIIKTLWGV